LALNRCALGLLEVSITGSNILLALDNGERQILAQRVCDYRSFQMIVYICVGAHTLIEAAFLMQNCACTDTRSTVGYVNLSAK